MASRATVSSSLAFRFNCAPSVLLWEGLSGPSVFRSMSESLASNRWPMLSAILKSVCVEMWRVKGIVGCGLWCYLFLLW